MRTFELFLLSIIASVLSSCMLSNEDKKCSNIGSVKRVSKMTGMNGFPIEKIQKEYYFECNGKRSSVVVGYTTYSNDMVTLYVTGNSYVKCGLTFPLDETKEMKLLEYVMVEITQNRYNVKDIQLSMKTCGIANLNIGRNYWKTRCLNKKDLQQPLFIQMVNVLRKYGYNVYAISNSDFYPLAAKELGYYHVMPDSFSLNGMGIDGVLILKCKK